MLNFVEKERYTFDDLVGLMVILRRDCPWDSEQTHRSIRMNFIEEAYEAVEAIDEGDTALLREELGDVLLQVVFHARMEEENGSFDIGDVADGICKKLIHRHPHIFGEVKADTAGQVLDNWENIKRHDKGGSYATSVENVAKALPALMRAEKILGRAAKAGFEFPSVSDAWDDLSEELSECKASIGAQSAVDEVGDVLFSMVNVARFLGVNPEEALERANSKFIRRFGYIEQSAAAEGGMDAIDYRRMFELWDEAKNEGL